MNNLEKIKEAHFELMTQYVEVLKKTSNLPFFVDISSLREMKPKPSSSTFWFNLYKIIIWPIKFFLRLFVWKPAISLFINYHILSKINEISKAYIYILQTTNPNDKSNQTIIKWLNQSVENCKSFASTIPLLKRLEEWFLLIINVFIGLTLALIGVDSVFRAILTMILEFDINSFLLVSASMLLFFATYGFVVYVLISFSFSAKRILLFSKIDYKMEKYYRLIPSKNIFKLENDLFKLIKTKKQLEFPIDIFILLLMTCILPIIAILFIIVSNIDKFPGLSVWNFLTAFISLAILPLVIGWFYIYEWKKREWR